MGDRLDNLAGRASGDAFFLGATLAAYAASEGLDDAGLAAALGCPVRTLTMVRLCRRPHADAPRFGQDVARIAARFGLDATVLAMAVRRADALNALRHGTAQSAGTLIAARDRVEREATDGAEEDRR